MGADNGTAKRKYCPYCGSALQSGSSFCANCGHSLTDPSHAERAGQPANDARPRTDESTSVRGPSSTMTYASTDDTSSNRGTRAAGPSESQDTAHEFDDFWATGDLGPMDAMDDEPITAAPISVPPRKKGIGVGVAIAVVLGIVAIVGVGVFFFRDAIFGGGETETETVTEVEESEATDSDATGEQAGDADEVKVPLYFDIPNYHPNTDTGIPVRATSIDENGNESSVDTFAYGPKSAIYLPPGEYTITFPSTPLTASGQLYFPPDTQLDLHVYPNGTVTGNDQSVVFEPLDPTLQIPDFIEIAYTWASADKNFVDVSDSYKAKALEVYNNAWNQQDYEQGRAAFAADDGSWLYRGEGIVQQIRFYIDQTYLSIYEALQQEDGSWATTEYRFDYSITPDVNDSGVAIGYEAIIPNANVSFSYSVDTPHTIVMTVDGTPYELYYSIYWDSNINYETPEVVDRTLSAQASQET